MRISFYVDEQTLRAGERQGLEQRLLRLLRPVSFDTGLG